VSDFWIKRVLSTDLYVDRLATTALLIATAALELLRDVLGAEVIDAKPAGRTLLPNTGACSRCGASTTRYGPAGSPLCDQCRDAGTSRPAKDAEPA
jgi:hypothetical protein